MALLPEGDLRRGLNSRRSVDREVQTPRVVPGQFDDVDQPIPPSAGPAQLGMATGEQTSKEKEPRMWRGLRRDSPCPAPGCRKRDPKLKKHAISVHLSPLFTDQPTGEQMDSMEFHTRRWNVIQDLARWVTNRASATPEQLVDYLNRTISVHRWCEVQEPAVPALQELCKVAGWAIPQKFVLRPLNSPALVVYWRVALEVLWLIPEDRRELLRRLHCGEIDLTPAGAEKEMPREDVIMDPPLPSRGPSTVDREVKMVGTMPRVTVHAIATEAQPSQLRIGKET